MTAREDDNEVGKHGIALRNQSTGRLSRTNKVESSFMKGAVQCNSLLIRGAECLSEKLSGVLTKLMRLEMQIE